MERPRLLDLFCGAGGAAMGYHRAGFEVVGVDIKQQPRYPFEFYQGDAMTWPLDGFDAIHASPPCQGYTAMRHAPGTRGAPLLIATVRIRLAESGVPWVMENVEGAMRWMISPVVLCGTMFGLEAHGFELRRHRLFESSFKIRQLPCAHTDRPVIGVYGAHARVRAARHGGRGTRDVWPDGHRQAAATALGIDWATLSEMSEAIPPAYTEHVGRQLIECVALNVGT